MSEHPTTSLDPIIHQPTRLGILTVLAEATSADFNYLQNTLALTAGNLSRHLAVLEESGLVAIRKTFEDRRPRTWISITKLGRDRLRREMESLRQLIDFAGQRSKQP